MKKRIILGMMLASTFALASCDLLNESSNDTTPKKTETDTTKPSKKDDTTITPSETKKEMKYDGGTATIDSWTNSSNSTCVKITVPVKNTGDVDIHKSSNDVIRYDISDV